MALKIKISAAPIRLRPNEGMEHANNLSPFLINGRCVKVVDLYIFLGPDRMGQRSRILSKLARAQVFDV